MKMKKSLQLNKEAYNAYNHSKSLQLVHLKGTMRNPA